MKFSSSRQVLFFENSLIIQYNLYPAETIPSLQC